VLSSSQGLATLLHVISMKRNYFIRPGLFRLLLKGVSLVLLASMGLKAMVDVDKHWDSWAYHLPFAARLWGIIPPEEYVLGPYWQSWYEGFGLLGEFL